MKNKQIILNSLKNSFRIIPKSKYMFSIIFITQLLFIILLSLIFAYYALSIAEHTQAIIEPLMQTEITSLEDFTSVYKDPEAIIQEYKSVINNIIMFFLSVYILYIILNGINWDISNLIVNKTSEFLHYQLSFAILALIFTLPAMLIINIISRLFTGVDTIAAIIIMGLIVLLISLYSI